MIIKLLNNMSRATSGVYCKYCTFQINPKCTTSVLQPSSSILFLQGSFSDEALQAVKPRTNPRNGKLYDRPSHGPRSHMQHDWEPQFYLHIHSGGVQLQLHHRNSGKQHGCGCHLLLFETENRFQYICFEPCDLRPDFPPHAAHLGHIHRHRLPVAFWKLLM